MFCLNRSEQWHLYLPDQGMRSKRVCSFRLWMTLREASCKTWLSCTMLQCVANFNADHTLHEDIPWRGSSCFCMLHHITSSYCSWLSSSDSYLAKWLPQKSGRRDRSRPPTRCKAINQRPFSDCQLAVTAQSWVLAHLQRELLQCLPCWYLMAKWPIWWMDNH